MALVWTAYRRSAAGADWRLYTCTVALGHVLELERRDSSARWPFVSPDDPPRWHWQVWHKALTEPVRLAGGDLPDAVAKAEALPALRRELIRLAKALTDEP